MKKCVSLAWRGGAEEARRANTTEDGGSKPSLAKLLQLIN